MAELGDEHMQASRIEEAVVAPKFEEDALGTDHFIPMLAKTARISDSRCESSCEMPA